MVQFSKKTMDPYQILTVTCAMAEQTTFQADMNMRSSIVAVENLLGYRFKNKRLLEEALTHSSHPDSASYERLEFVGDAALGLVITNYVFLAYPGLDPGQLSLLRAANISTEKLARVAVRNRLYSYLRHNVSSLDVKVSEFARVVQHEIEGNVPYGGGVVKAPKVLADIVESIAAAVYVDCDFDLKALWVVIRGILEPIVTLETLQHQPQPVTKLFEFCQKQQKQVDIKHWRKGSKSIASVYVDGKYVSSSSSKKRETAKINVAKEALQKLSQSESTDMVIDRIPGVASRVKEINRAKQKLHDLSAKKGWGKPSYRVEKEVGPAHNKRFGCSVQIETQDGAIVTSGNEHPRVKVAETSAASMMLHSLKEI